MQRSKEVPWEEDSTRADVLLCLGTGVTHAGIQFDRTLHNIAAVQSGRGTETCGMLQCSLVLFAAPRPNKGTLESVDPPDKYKYLCARAIFFPGDLFASLHRKHVFHLTLQWPRNNYFLRLPESPVDQRHRARILLSPATRFVE